MIELEKARRIAQKEYPEYPIAEIVDIGDRWAFDYDSGDPPIPGIPHVTVNKEDASVGYLTIPPLENIAIIESGTVIEDTVASASIVSR